MVVWGVFKKWPDTEIINTLQWRQPTIGHCSLAKEICTKICNDSTVLVSLRSFESIDDYWPVCAMKLDLAYYVQNKAGQKTPHPVSPSLGRFDFPKFSLIFAPGVSIILLRILNDLGEVSNLRNKNCLDEKKVKSDKIFENRITLPLPSLSPDAAALNSKRDR